MQPELAPEEVPAAELPEEVAQDPQGPGKPAAPAAAPAAAPYLLERTYSFIKKEKLAGVAEHLPDDYQEFEEGMLTDPDNVKALHQLFKEQKWEGADLDERQFSDLLLGGLKKKAQPAPVSGASAGLPGAPTGVTGGPTSPPGDQEFQQPVAEVPGGPAPLGVGDVPAEASGPSAEQLAALAALPGGARPELAIGAGGERLFRQYGDLPEVAEGSERVRLPDDYQGPEAPGTYQIPGSTEPEARYFDRPLSKEVAGEGEQGLGMAAARNFNNLVADGFKGLATGLDDASRLISNATGLSRGGAFADVAEVMEKTKKPVAPYYQTHELLAHPSAKNLLMATSDVAGMAVPLVAQALAPEAGAGRALASALGTGAGLMFDGQIIQGAHDRAVAAKMEPDQVALYTLLDAGLSLATFKVGGAVLGQAAGKLTPDAVKSEIMRDAYRILATREAGAQLTREELKGVLAQATAAATPRLLKVLKEGGTLGTLFGVNEAKTILTEAAARQTIGAKFTQPTLGEAVKRVVGATAEGATIGSLTGAGAPAPPRTLALGSTPGGRSLSVELDAQGAPARYLDEQGAPVDFGKAGPPPAVVQATQAAVAANPAPLAAEQVAGHQRVPTGKYVGDQELYADYSAGGKATRLYTKAGQHFSLDDPKVRAVVEAKWPDAEPPKGRDASASTGQKKKKEKRKTKETPVLAVENPESVTETLSSPTTSDERNGTADERNPAPVVPEPAQPLSAVAAEPAQGSAPVVAEAPAEPGAVPAGGPAGAAAVPPVYAPAGENPRVAARKVSGASQPALALEIRPDPQDPTRATFTLNPQADQARLIGDGVSSLAHFFDYNAPAGKVTGLLPAAEGRLELRDGEWHVVQKAKIQVEDGSKQPEPGRDTAAVSASARPAVADAESARLSTDSPVGTSAILGVAGGESSNSGSPSPEPATPRPYGTPGENRAAGAFEKDGQVYTRQAPLGERVARGKEATAEFSSGVQQPVRYAVMEAADLQPSHLGGNQNLAHFLPEAQPKNRSAAFDPASQKAIADIAASPDLGRLGEAPNAYSGAPIVNQRGEALQGNGRAAGIREHYKQGGEAYKRDVVAAAERAGIPAERTAGFREPVLVRIADVSDARARELGNYTAADTESGGKRRLDPRQASGRMSEEDRTALTRLATPQGEQTLAETIRGNAEGILRFLRKGGLVNETQLQTMAKPDGTLTPQGVEDVAALYRHQLFRDGDPNLPELFAELPAAAQGGLDRAVAGLLSVPEQASLVPDVQDALYGVREFQNSGADFNTWAGQADMFKGGLAPRERYSPLTLKLVEKLATEKRPTYIARLFNEYAAAVKGEAASLFGETPPKSRAEAVAQTFGVKDEPARNARAAESAPRPGDADQRPAPPESPAVPGPAEGNGAAPPAAGAAAEPAKPKRVGNAYLAPDDTKFTGPGAMARAAEHTFATGLVGQRVRAYGGGVDVVEAVEPSSTGGFTYKVRDEATGQARTYGGFIKPEDVLSPATADVRGSGPKVYADLAEAPPVMQQAGRIQPEPIRGEKPKAQDKIILDLSKGTGVNIFFTKRPGGRKSSRALGSYNPRNAAVAIRAENDLDVTAHELGHALDDAHGLLPKASAQALAEIQPLARFGSTPPAGHPDPQNYRTGEAVAEWVRAYLVNPDATRQAYPEFTRHYEQAVPAKVRASVDGFGRDIRVFAGATAHEQVMSNVRMKPAEKGGFMDVLRPDNQGRKFYLTFGDRVGATMLNAMRPFEKAMNYARDIAGPRELAPEHNPNVLARLFLGLNDKMDNMMRRGLVDSRNQRRIDEQTGEVKNLTWLLDPLDKTTEGTIAHEQELVVSAALARRTVELVERAVPEEIEAALARGEYIDDAFLQSNPKWEKQFKAASDANKQSLFPKKANIAEYEKETVSGIGGGVFTDMSVARRRIADHETLKAQNPEQHARIEEAARRLQSWADDNLRYLVERGRLSQEQYDVIKENNAEYIAMQRVMEAQPGAEIKLFSRGPGGKNFTVAKQPLQKIKGSGRMTKNPYSSLLDATYAVTREGDRNAIMQAMRELFVGSRQMNDEDVQALGEVARPATADDDNVVPVYVNGEIEHWQLDADVYQAINEMANQPLDGVLAQVLKSPAAILRWTVTHSPVFAARNVIRDTRGRLIVSNNGATAGLDVLTSQAVRTEAKDGLELAGGGQAGHYLRDETAYYDTMQGEMRRLAKDKRFILADPKRLASEAWEKYERALGGSETINRLAEYRAAYKKAKAKGMDDYNASLFAAHEARDLMDFAVAGTFLREVNKYVPFTNAAVQGVRKAVRSAAENPGGFAGRWVVSALLPTILLRGLIHKMGRDDEYRQLPAYQRDGFDNIPLPSGKWLVIPRPFELGTLAASADRFLSQHALDQDPNAFEGYGGSLGKSFVPVDESAVAGGLKPIVEVLTNHDFFKNKSIISPAEAKLDVEFRHTERGSRLGQWLQKGTGIDSRYLDHLIAGTGSYYGNWLMKASNWGREEGGQTFGLPDTGFLKEQPVTQARDVQWLQRRLEGVGLGQSKPARQLEQVLQAYYAQHSDADRQRVGQLVTEYAQTLRDFLDAEQLRQVGQLKKAQRDAKDR